MYQVFQIANYQYYSFSSREIADPVIKLLDANNNIKAYLYFKDDSQPLPQAKQFSTGPYALYYRRHYFSEIIDMLRNEGPIFLHWMPLGTNNTHLSTSSEPIGEGEEG